MKQTIQLPPELNTPAFREAWADWVGHRKEIRHALSERAARICVRKCEVWGHDAAIAAIEHSIAAGYQGLFPAPAAPLQSRGNQSAQPRQKPLSTWEIKERLKACQDEYKDLVFPGGCAHAIELAGTKASRAEQLVNTIADLRRQLTSGGLY